ncbi:E3 ubiquitin ligase PQT3-like isoform X2 [Vicia villosa]|uniref:E3 ubiquitin ligase PQT3-like isoform X2 n=1 Tax=Vicia villosa TaxID=3911 RepID=UPI00273CC566|nr:E3 ubiquitin ligase PQT3-like isoform X2 [Vicia villosa]
MAVYYKFKSAKDYDSIPMDGPFISVGTLKQNIFVSKHLGRGTDFDLLVTNAQTNEEYLDEEMLIPKNTSVLIRRVPGRTGLPIVTELHRQEVENKVVETEPENISLPADETSAMKYPENLDWDEFGNDLYSIPDQLPVQSNNMILEAPPTINADEDSKIKALIDTPALDWQHQGSDFGPGRGFQRGMGGRMGGGRGFGLERKTPPEGYVCHRCKVPGHFIQHCPTNGDSTFDIKKVRQPTGIPRSMLMVNPQGSYALQNGSVAVLKPNEAAFDKEMEGLSSTRSVGDLPPELHCPLCNNVMKNAVLTSKCCFKSFCDKCIRDYIMSKSACVCHATNVLADDLLPNKTLRDTINRILESGNSSTENAGSTYQVQDMESSRCQQPMIPSPTSSAAPKGEPKVLLVNEGITNIQEIADDRKPVSSTQHVSEQVKIPRAADVSEATRESMSMKELASQGSAKLVEEEVQQKVLPIDAGKKKKKKKVRMPTNDVQWKTPHDFGGENYMMPMGPPPPSYNPYWNGMQPCMDGFMTPYAAPMQMMGYGPGPFDMPFAGGLAQDPYGMQGYMMPAVPPHRDFAEFGTGMNVPPPVMNREEFDARNANMRRKHENERWGERDFSKDREFGREVSSVGDVSSMKSKTKSNPPSSGAYPISHQRHQPSDLNHRSARHYSDRNQEDEQSRPHKSKPEHYSDRNHEDERRNHHSNHRPETTYNDRQQKSNIFSRISFSAEEEAIAKKKKKASTSTTESNGFYEVRKDDDDGSDDDERHFKRKRSRYELVDSRERKHR